MHPMELKRRFEAGENITSLLKAEAGSNHNSEEIIETAYDLQAGSYIAALDNPDMAAHKRAYAQQIAREIESLGPVDSLLEPGVGEGTTLGLVAEALRAAPTHIHGFDLSWSRVAHARRWLASRGQGAIQLSVASLLHMPFPDQAFDVVYTAHTLEPNGGRERVLLAELARVASRYLLLLEPSWEHADAAGRARMERLGYVRDLPGHARSLGLTVLRHERFAHTANPLNPTALTVIALDPSAPASTPQFACPRHQEPLTQQEGAWFSPRSLRAYPCLGGLPVLRPEAGVLASAWRETAGD